MPPLGVHQPGMFGLAFNAGFGTVAEGLEPHSADAEEEKIDPQRRGRVRGRRVATHNRSGYGTCGMGDVSGPTGRLIGNKCMKRT